MDALGFDYPVYPKLAKDVEADVKRKKEGENVKEAR